MIRRILTPLLAAAAAALQAAGERARAGARQMATLGLAAVLGERARAAGVYRVEHRDAAGRLLWSDRIDNVVTTAGKTFALETLFGGSAYTAAWYMGLIDAAGYTGAPVAADTAASHATWAEFTNYVLSTRPAVGWATASGGSKASTGTSFSVNASGTIKGCFLISASVKGGTTGTLYSAGLFSGGDQAVTAGGTLTVTYTATLT